MNRLSTIIIWAVACEPNLAWSPTMDRQFARISKSLLSKVPKVFSMLSALSFLHLGFPIKHDVYSSSSHSSFSDCVGIMKLQILWEWPLPWLIVTTTSGWSPWKPLASAFEMLLQPRPAPVFLGQACRTSQLTLSHVLIQATCWFHILKIKDLCNFVLGTVKTNKPNSAFKQWWSYFICNLFMLHINCTALVTTLSKTRRISPLALMASSHVAF